MNSRILRAVIVIAPWVLGWWVLRDVQQPLSYAARPIVVTPVIISASRRDYPSVIENRGKWFHSRETLYTARHVISDTWYNYVADKSISLIALYQLSWDLASAQFSGQIATWSLFRYTTWLQTDQILMAQYRNDHWDRLTGSIVASGDAWIIINLPVIAGDSGSPVIFADRTLWAVSQSHSGDQAIIQRIR